MLKFAFEKLRKQGDLKERWARGQLRRHVRLAQDGRAASPLAPATPVQAGLTRLLSDVCLAIGAGITG
ncbi:hypothetical protein XH88_08685 [Bradyrhizobium sp. CCBAU 51627]|nr:hypothetical protein [Bradyrhizobium sp. CCBAU 51627]